MTPFMPIRCPCGHSACKKWIMEPYFGCQCSSVDDKTKDELIAMYRDAARYRWLRDVADKMKDPCSFASDVFKGGVALDELCDLGIRDMIAAAEKRGDLEVTQTELCHCQAYPHPHPAHDTREPYTFVRRNHAS